MKYKHYLFRYLRKFKRSFVKYELAHFYNNTSVSFNETAFIDDYFSFDTEGEPFLLTIDSQTHIKKHCHILIGKHAELKIGSKVFFNNYCSINCLNKITIGDNTMFGEGVKLYDHDHAFAYIDETLNVAKNKFSKAPITIGSNCWLGSNVTVLKGVTIGNNVVIGANNLIFEDIMPNTIVKGNFTKTLTTYPGN